ncbi:MAG TPA: NAD(P)/FAD-dependent oxidoreductase [Gemmatimonadaceae bacterium]|nr:NAD(P)/FAD-dependent oxidoreductase [Gemmatimonadaceae bacterium]
MPDSQAIVVGGGPAGSSTAFFLARLGIDTMILDRARFPRDKTCSEYLSPQATRILAEMNARDAIESAGAAQLTGMRVHAPNGATIHGEFAATHGFRGYSDRGLAVRRTILDSILLDRARDAGAQVEEAVRVTDLIQDADGRVTGLRTRDEHGTSRERHADLIIGADGLRSVIARRLGLVKPARWPRRIALVTHFSGARDVGNLGEMHVERGGYCGIASVGSGLVNVAVVVPVSRAADVAVDRTEFFESWIAERPALAAKLGAATRVGKVRATGPFATSARRAWHPGAALVGDAAEFFDPFTGEGIYTALRGGELLAEFAAGAIRKPATANASLKEYERMRRKEFSGKWLVERIVGTAIAFPPLINRAAKVLSRRRDMADLLVGVVGDFVPAREVLRAGYLLNLIFDS